MKFQCVFCMSAVNVTAIDLGQSVTCPSCSKLIVIPRKSFDKGRIVGEGFVLQRPIGSGGMGSVYLASQLSLERPVALKILSRRYSVDDKYRDEFAQEARAVSRLTHNSLVQIYSFGDDSGDLYLAMEYIDGVTLGDRIQNESRLIVDEALHIIQQIAEGLFVAWDEVELIHRDIKPDNIMLTAKGIAKLTDMGLARKAIDLAEVKEVSGTPAYMNPEQFLRNKMDCRADIYSLGVVLYHSITGKLPFEADNVRELARQHIEDSVLFPQDVDVPPRVKKLIRKMMAKLPEKRYENHEVLLREIYDIRLSLNNNDSALVPGVHTVSMKRYEFRDMHSHKTSSELHTRDLADEHRPLSSITRRFGNRSASEERTAGNRLLLALALLLSAVAFGAAFVTSDEGETVFYIETRELIESFNGGDLSPALKLVELNKHLELAPQGSSSLYDFQAMTSLYKVRAELQEMLHKDGLSEAESELQKKNKALLSSEKNIKAFMLRLKEVSSENEGLKSELRLNRSELLRLDARKKEVVEVPEYRFMADEELHALDFYWNKDRQLSLSGIMTSIQRGGFVKVEKYLQVRRDLLKGSFRKWYDDQLSFLQYYEEFRSGILKHLDSRQGEEFEVTGVGTFHYEKEDEQWYLLTDAGQRPLSKLASGDLLLLARNLDMKEFTFEHFGYFCLMRTDFQLALEHGIPKHVVDEYLQAFVDERYDFIAKQVREKNQNAARESYNKFLISIKGLKTESLLRSRLESFFEESLSEIEK